MKFLAFIIMLFSFNAFAFDYVDDTDLNDPWTPANVAQQEAFNNAIDDCATDRALWGAGPNATPVCKLITIGTDTAGNFVASVATTAPLTGGAAGSEATAISLGCQTASGSQPGCLSSTDWTTFNNKLGAEVDGSTSNELQNIFQTIDASSGTDPVADTTTDTFVVSGTSPIVVTGDSGADSITISFTQPTETECFPLYAPVDTILATDDITSVWRAPAALTITEVWCETNTGTVDMDLQIDDGTPADIMGTDLACDTSGETDSSSLTGTMAAGDRIDFAITSVASSPTRVTACIRFIRN